MIKFKKNFYKKYFFFCLTLSLFILISLLISKISYADTISCTATQDGSCDSLVAGLTNRQICARAGFNYCENIWGGLPSHPYAHRCKIYESASCYIPAPTNTPIPPTTIPFCEIEISHLSAECISCSIARAPYLDCRGNKTGRYQAYATDCSESSVCQPAPFPLLPPAPTAEGTTPTAAPRAPTAAVRAPTVAAGRPAQSIDTTCEGSLEMVVNGDTCEYKSSWKMSAPEGDGKCEVWLRSAVSGELTQMVDGNGAPVTDCNAQAESSDFKLNSGEDFDLVISNGKSECSNKVVASKKCEASAASEPSSGDEQPPVEAPAPVVGPAIGDSKCTDAGFALDGEEYGQCGGDMHNTCDEASDGRADDNEELVVKRFKNEDGELRYLTQNRGKTPGVCGNPVSTPRPARSPTAGGNGGKPGSRSSGNAACKIGSQSPRVSDTCAQCIGMAQHVKPMDPGKFNVCSDTQVTNYWCNGGVSEGAKNDCTEAKQKRCLAQCAGPTAAKQPTNTPAPGAPTETSTPAASGELPEDIKKLDGAEPIGCLSLADIIKIEADVRAGTKTRAEANELYSINRLTDSTTGKYLCEKQRKNP